MSEYMLLVRNQMDHQAGWPPEKHQRFLKSCEAYIDGLMKDGRLKIAQPLVREGVLLSGLKGAWKESPFNEGNEVQVGYYHIVAKDLREAIDIAKGNPEFEFGTTARVEVRPIKAREESTGYAYPGKAG
jgi:hypothetical protein